MDANKKRDAETKAEISRMLFLLKREVEAETLEPISAADLARKAGLTPTVWSGYVRKHYIPSQDNARSIGELIGRYLGSGEQEKWLTLCGLDTDLQRIVDPRLKCIAENWPIYPEALRGELYELGKEPAREECQ